MKHEHGSPECRRIFERLSEYIDGELPEDLCSRIEGHMDGCAPCQAFLESLRRAVGLIGRQDPVVLPDELRRRVLEAYGRLTDEQRDAGS
jgi:RNA polymerase sigma-70 factor (ECF subfamily)